MIPLYDLNPHRRFPWVTILIIAANIAVMIPQGFQADDLTAYKYGFIAKRVQELPSGKPVRIQTVQMNAAGRIQPGPVLQFSANPVQVYLTILTAMFLHANLIHLGMNMWMLWIFGNNIEDRLGWIMYICFYLVGGMLGTFCQYLANPGSTVPMIGASGAVAAVLGGYAITYPKAMVRTLIFVGLVFFVDLPALVVLGIWFLLQMAAGLNIMRELMGGENVAFWAHIGGFAAGVVLMPLLSLGASPADADWKTEVQELFRFEDPRIRRE